MRKASGHWDPDFWPRLGAYTGAVVVVVFFVILFLRYAGAFN